MFEPEQSESPNESPAKRFMDQVLPEEMELLKQSLKNIPELLNRDLHTAN
jgi:hypothetical protein